MKQNHVVLRANRLGSRNVFSGPAAVGVSMPAPLEMQVDVQELRHADVARVTRDADVVSVAPVMPMKLVEPRNVADATAAEAGVMSWGVKAVKADTSPFTGEGIVVSVLDTGIDAAHVAFDGVDVIQKNFTDEAPGDMHGHGTHVAGTIFGRKVGNTRIGVAPGIKRALIGKVLGQGGGSSDKIVSAIQWAVDNGAHIVSMSLGIDFPGYAKFLIENQDFPEEVAVSMALEGYRANVMLFERMASLVHSRMQGTLIIAAAGNESQRNLDARFEIGVSPPAVADGVISVAAMGRNAQGKYLVAPFSNTGANVAGPGVDVISAALGGGLRKMSGTSMAAPHVAGVAALWAQRIASMQPLNVLTLTAKLVASGSPEGFAPDVDMSDVGAGLVMAPQA